MQKSVLQKLEGLRDEKNSKALLVAATGTGKTYLSAFDVKSFILKSFYSCLIEKIYF